ncbi:unnamed protein product, partial [Effrenium voratum]
MHNHGLFALHGLQLFRDNVQAVSSGRPMANRTDPDADTVHGANPQFLVDRIVRVKIYNDAYWKEYCFGLTTESLIDEAAKLDYVAGTYGGRRRPSRFLCLFLKLLQIQPQE